MSNSTTAASGGRVADYSPVEVQFTPDPGPDFQLLFDGMHAEETFHLHLLRRLLKDPAVQAALPHTSARVEAALSDPATNFYYPRFSK